MICSVTLSPFWILLLIFNLTPPFPSSSSVTSSSTISSSTLGFGLLSLVLDFTSACSVTGAWSPVVIAGLLSPSVIRSSLDISFPSPSFSTISSIVLSPFLINLFDFTIFFPLSFVSVISSLKTTSSPSISGILSSSFNGNPVCSDIIVSFILSPSPSLSKICSVTSFPLIILLFTFTFFGLPSPPSSITCSSSIINTSSSSGFLCFPFFFFFPFFFGSVTSCVCEIIVSFALSPSFSLFINCLIILFPLIIFFNILNLLSFSDFPSTISVGALSLSFSFSSSTVELIVFCSSVISSFLGSSFTSSTSFLGSSFVSSSFTTECFLLPFLPFFLFFLPVPVFSLPSFGSSPSTFTSSVFWICTSSFGFSPSTFTSSVFWICTPSFGFSPSTFTSSPFCIWTSSFGTLSSSGLSAETVWDSTDSTVGSSFLSSSSGFSSVACDFLWPFLPFFFFLRGFSVFSGVSVSGLFISSSFSTGSSPPSCAGTPILSLVSGLFDSGLFNSSSFSTGSSPPSWAGTPILSLVSGLFDSGLFNSSSFSTGSSPPSCAGTPSVLFGSFGSSEGSFVSFVSVVSVGFSFSSSFTSGFSSVSFGCVSNSVVVLSLSSSFGLSWTSSTFPIVSTTFWESSLFLFFFPFFFFLPRLSKFICIKQSPRVTNFINFL